MTSTPNAQFWKQQLDRSAEIATEDAAAVRRLVHTECDDPEVILAALGLEEDT